MAQIKRLILCCDGTWNDSISTNNPLTNVARFSRVVKESAEDGVLQIVYYHTGVGAGTSRISNSIDGAVGRGLGANVRNAYNFLCQNFNHKDCNDEIYLVGFSRGAFTVRCVASLVDSIGVLTKPGLSRLYDAYGLWKNQSEDGLAVKAFVEGLKSEGLVKTGIKIKACGVWDTVSAIGVQLPSWLPQPPRKRLAHVDNRIPSCVEHAFHAMALDERRSTFWPIPWSEPRDHSKLGQCWFLGSHSDVGGGYEDAGLANVALVWMVAQFQHFTSLAFDVNYLLDFLVTKEVEIKRKEFGASASVRGIGGDIGYELMRVKETSRYKGEAGKIANSFTPLWQAFGQRPRMPGTSFLMNKMQHSIGVSGAKDDLGVTSSSTPQRGLNTVTIVRNEETETDSDTALGDQMVQSTQATCDTIHFTVRVVLAKQYHYCQVLDSFCTARRSADGQQIFWQRLDDRYKGKGKRPLTKPDQHLSIDEAKVTTEEANLLRLWLNAAAARGMMYSTRKETRVGSVRASQPDNVSQSMNSLKADKSFSHATEFIFPALPDGISDADSDGKLEDVKTLLDNAREVASLDLWLLLYAHFDECMRPSLMYNSDTTEPTR